LKVSEYIKNGLKNFVENLPPEDYQLLGEAQEKIHKIRCFAKINNDIIEDAKFNSSKRCKKLLSIADFICEKIKNQKLNEIKINDNDILEFFKEEKDREKLIQRLILIKKALGL